MLERCRVQLLPLSASQIFCSLGNWCRSFSWSESFTDLYCATKFWTCPITKHLLTTNLKWLQFYDLPFNGWKTFSTMFSKSFFRMFVRELLSTALTLSQTIPGFHGPTEEGF